MAKRKKKRSGGGFGKPKPATRGGGQEPEIIDRTRRGEPTLKLIERILENKEFESEEAMQHFFENELLQKSPEDLLAMADEIVPPTDAEKAERLLNDLPDDCTIGDVLEAAHAAIAHAPDCIAAWLMLGVHEPDEAKALEYTDKGIERATALFQDEIENIHDDLGLWGNIATRDLLRLLANKARLHEETPGGFELAEAAYRQCLAWNANDNVGIRGNLLRLMMVQRRIDEAQALVEAFPDDSSTVMIWGGALLAIVQAIDRTGYDPPESDLADQYPSPRAYLDTLGPEFDEAKHCVRKAARANPFVPYIITEPGLFEVDVPGMIVANGPFEAVEYLQKWAVVWQIAGLPMVMLTDSLPKNLESQIKGRGMAQEIVEIAGQLDEYDGPGWWQVLHDQVAENEKPGS